MSQRELEAVIGRAIVDQEFRMELFANPTAALAGYELSDTEVAALWSVDAESLDGCAIMCGGRIHRDLALRSTLIASCAMVKFGVHGVSEEDGVTKQPSKGEHHERHVDYNRICCH